MNRTTIVLSTVAVTLLVLVAIGFGVLYAGLYPVSAQQPHTPVGRWLLATAKHQGIAARASSQPPAALTNDMAAAGAGRFVQTCAHCHGAPGMEKADFAPHMRPQPPDLAQAAGHMASAELYWVITNGLRMTGMPAFGPLLDDDEIWNLVALIERLPDLSRQEFQDMVTDAAAGTAGTSEAPEESAVQVIGPDGGSDASAVD